MLGIAQMDQGELFQPEPIQIIFDGGLELLWTRLCDPAFIRAAPTANLGADDEPGWIGIQGLNDQAIGDERTVVRGGVQVIDAELDRPAQDAARLLRITWLTPYAGPGGRHVAKRHAGEGYVPQSNRASLARINSF